MDWDDGIIVEQPGTSPEDNQYRETARDNYVKAKKLISQLEVAEDRQTRLHEVTQLFLASYKGKFNKSAYELGRICEFGLGLPINLPVAAGWYEKALIGEFIFSPKSRQNFLDASKESLQNWKKDAQRGLERVLAELGEKSWLDVLAKYAEPVNMMLSIHTWLLAETGDAESQYILGKRYMDGVWIEKNYKIGLEWLNKASDQGFFRAPYQIGLAYYLGEGVQKDFKNAQIWFRNGAERKYNEACYALGYLYQEGHGVAKNIELARYWYHKALDMHFPPNDFDHDKGHEKAQKALQYLFYPQNTRSEPVSPGLRRKL